MATEQERDPSVDCVAVFITLHYDTLRHTTIERVRGDGVEKIAKCCIDGKFRPCLILGTTDDHFQVWCATAKEKDARSYIPLEGVHGLKGNGFLELHPDAIRWIHRSLRFKWIGRQDREANACVWDELNQMMLKASRRSPQRRET